MKKRFLISIALLGVLLLFFDGCGGGYVKLKMLEPAQITLPGVKTIAVSNFEYAGGFIYSEKPEILFANSLTQALLNNGFYKVVERQQLDKILREKNLSISGLTANDSNMIGQLLNVGAIISGVIADYSVKNSGEWITVKRYNAKEKKYYYKKMYKATRTAHVDVTFKIIDVSTAQILLTKEFSRSLSTTKKKYSKMDAINALPMGKSMLNDLRNDICARFVRMIAPHTVYRSEKLLKGKDPRFKNAIQYAKNGLWDNAIPLLKEISNNPNVKDKIAAYYDLAIAYEALSNYDDALRIIDKALALSSKSFIIQKKVELKSLKRKKEKLIQQLNGQ